MGLLIETDKGVNLYAGVIYASWKPATLIRDVNILSKLDYEVQRVQTVDMFGQTGHVKCVCLLERV